MARDPPSSDSEDSDTVQVYRYESEGEERLGTSARALFREADGDYRCMSLFMSRTPNALFKPQWHEHRCWRIRGGSFFPPIYSRPFN